MRYQRGGVAGWPFTFTRTTNPITLEATEEGAGFIQKAQAYAQAIAGDTNGMIEASSLTERTCRWEQRDSRTARRAEVRQPYMILHQMEAGRADPR